MALSWLALLPSLEAAALGGGYTACGLSGEYFANTTLTGPSVFTRQDNRLDFDWGTSLPVGGSNSPGYSTFPHDNFSVRWTGGIIPRFSETYTFTVSATTGVRLWVNNVLLVDQWAAASTHTASVALVAGNTYSIKLEYLHLTGAASVRLSWSSPSVPEEVIDPVSVQSINLSDYPSQLFADAIKTASAGGSTGIAWYDMSMNVLAATQIDSKGWPLLDSQMDLTTETGRYLLVFNGKADVVIASRWFGNKGSFVVNGVTYTTLPSGIGYDAVTNTTVAEVNSLGAVNGSGETNLRFTNTQRTSGSAVGTGVTNVQLYRPTSYNGSTHSPRGSVAAVNIKPVIQNYAVMRYFSAAFGDERSWDERVQPGFPVWNNAPAVVAPLTRGSNKACWELLIMLANEVGKDLYICTSVRADHDYYVKLANLVKYGSDGTLPYTSTSQWPGSGPVYPPLNPNLRFHIEFSNEVWNYGFSMNGWIYQDSKDAVDLALGKTLDHTPPSIVNATDGLILNYDGKGWGDWKRWQALQTVNISNTFRLVFGDAAMGNRIRILLFDQYGGYGSQMTQFIDNYFNKSDSATTYTGTPHPVSYYIWGGGGAIYYSSSNSQGIDPSVALGNSSFEEPVLSAETSVSAPSGAAWTFAGNAGIYHGVERTAVTGQTFGASSTAQRSVGFKFTVGASPIYVYQLGRYVIAKGGTRTLHLYNAAGSNLVTTTNLDTSNKPLGQYAYLTPQLADWPFNQNNPVVLAANTTYYLICDENGNSYYDGTTAVTAGPGITIDGAVTYANSTFTVDRAGSYSYGPLNFIYTTAPNGSLGIVQNAPNGKQGAYIGDTGSISQTITVPTAGVYSLYMNAGFQLDYAYWLSSGQRRSINGNPINITIDGVLCNAYSQTNPPYMVSSSKWSPGGWGIRDYDLWVNWGTAPVQLSSGTHTVTYTGTGAVGTYIFLDNIRVCSEAALFGPNATNFPSNGEAYGQDNSSAIAGWASFAKTVCNWPITWGMKAMAYEGGNSLGGDFTQSPLNSYCKYVSPLATQADIRAIDTYTRAGGSFFGHYYAQWYGNTPDGAVNAPLVQSAIQKNNLLPAEANNGSPVPRAIPGSQHTLSASASNGVISALNGWCSYNIIVQQYGSYQITCNTQGSGTYHLQLDDGTRLLSNATAGGSVTTASVALTAGMHNLRLQSTSAATLTVNSITIFMAGAPTAPVLSPIYTFANGECQITWGASSGAVMYGVDIGTTSNNYTQSFPVSGTTATITGLDNNTVYYLAVYARDANGLRSLYSSELRIAQRSSDPTALIDFEEQALTASAGYATEPLMSKGFTFTSEGNSGGTALLVNGASSANWPGPYASTVVQARFWGSSISMTKTGGGTFDIHTLFLDSRGFSANYAIITATDPSGMTFTQTVNLSATTYTATPILNWVRVTKVNVAFYRASDGRQLSGAIDNIMVNPPVPKITTTALPNAAPGEPYSTTLSATGGQGTLIWSISTGTPPSGVSLSPSGVISGTPVETQPLAPEK
ncbi:MAG: PA14 domain-containing protein [Verrucomicrobiota bacterium]|nr:PA14 domain-containing protein [Verrucomicrobiota bacterium]